MKVLILGYYNRDNLGDDMFSFVFKKFFQTYWPNLELVIQNTDDVDLIPHDVSAVICGGGDLINDYFLDKIKALVADLPSKIPVYAIGVGIPYPNMIDQGALDIFDFVIHRNKGDQLRLLNKYGKSRVKYFPDLGFMLPKYSDSGISTPEYRVLVDPSNSAFQKIGVFLSRTIYKPGFENQYKEIISNLGYFLAKLASIPRQRQILGVRSRCLQRADLKKYQIYLLPCGTKENSSRENDTIINRDLLQMIKNHYSDKFSSGSSDTCSNVFVIDTPMAIQEVIPIFKQFTFNLCSRFHAHIYSILANVPFISIYSSRKVKNLIESLGFAPYGIEMEVDQNYLNPIKLNNWPLFEKYHLLVSNSHQFKTKLKSISDQNRKEMKFFTHYLNNLIFTPVKYLAPETKAFKSLVQDKTNQIANLLVEAYLPSSSDFAQDVFVKQLALNQEEVTSYHQGDIIRLVDLVNAHLTQEPEMLVYLTDQQIEELQRKEVSKKQAIHISQVISFVLTGIRCSQYNYGLEQQVLGKDYNLYESVKYILIAQNDNLTYEKTLTNPVDVKFRKFNLKYFKQHDLMGFHRSGWSYVLDHLQNFHHPAGPIFDSFLDKTFGWNYDFYQKIGILPFTQPWVGVFHHTPDQNYSHNNLVDFFSKPLFAESLIHCRGIYVLSKYLQKWIKNKLKEMGQEQVLVESLTHPTEFVDLNFCHKNFILNPEKKVIQIGAWLRNSYAIFNLPQPKILKKYALKGKNMDNYFITPDQLQEVVNNISDVGTAMVAKEMIKDRPHETICRLGECFCNKYLVGLVGAIEQNNHSVVVLDDVDNDQYDQLLSQNVVFLNLVNCSAVNTVIECIVRNTPLVVNRLEALEEYLGKDYPLFYQTQGEALEMLNSYQKIKEGYCYLSKMDKTKFKIESFLQQVISSEIYRGV